MAEMQFEEWMTDADGMMWNIERDPVLRSTILSVWVLDGKPDPERWERTLGEALDAIPRLRQRVIEDPLGLSPPRWESDPHFSIDYHLRRLHLGGEGSLRDLLDLSEPIAMQSFDRDRPLWEFYLVDGMAGGRSGVIMKLHHAVTDGVGAVRMTESLVERDREGTRRRQGSAADGDAGAAATAPDPAAAGAPDPAEEDGTLARIRRAAVHRFEINSRQRRQVADALVRGAGAALRDPVGALTQVRDTAASIGRLLRTVSEPMSPVMTGRSMSLDLNQFVVSLDELKGAARKVGCTLNDAFVAGIAGGFARYHERHGKPVDELRMSMPVNLREGDGSDRAGNQFAPVRFAVPLRLADPVERMRAVHELVLEQRAEPALPLTEEVMSVAARLGVSANIALASGMMKAMDFTTSNVPGPRFPVFVSGAKIEHMYPFGPTAGAAVNITLFSYDGNCHVGVNSNRGAVADPELLVECLEKGMGEVLNLA